MSYRDVFFQNEVEQSKYAFDESNAPKLFEQFAFFESEAKRLLEAKLPLPGYEMILKAGHTFNLLDARGAISVTERAAYIGRIRNLSRLVATAYVEAREALGFPMLPPEQRRPRMSMSAAGPSKARTAANGGSERSERGGGSARCWSSSSPRSCRRRRLKAGRSVRVAALLKRFAARGFLGEAAQVTPFATPRRLGGLDHRRRASIAPNRREQ